MNHSRLSSRDDLGLPGLQDHQAPLDPRDLKAPSDQPEHRVKLGLKENPVFQVHRDFLVIKVLLEKMALKAVKALKALKAQRAKLDQLENLDQGGSLGRLDLLDLRATMECLVSSCSRTQRTCTPLRLKV